MRKNQYRSSPWPQSPGGAGQGVLQGIHVLKAQQKCHRVERSGLQIGKSRQFASIPNQKAAIPLVALLSDLDESRTRIDTNVPSAGASDERGKHPLAAAHIQHALSTTRLQ